MNKFEQIRTGKNFTMTEKCDRGIVDTFYQLAFLVRVLFSIIPEIYRHIINTLLLILYRQCYRIFHPI